MNRMVPGTFNIPFDCIVHGKLEAQRDIEELKVDMIFEAQKENHYVDLQSAGLVTTEYTVDELESEPKLIYDVTAQWMPFGGQHGILGVQKYIEHSSTGAAYWKDQGTVLINSQISPWYHISHHVFPS